MLKTTTAPSVLANTLVVHAAVNYERDESSGASRWFAEVDDHSSPVAGVNAYGRTYGQARQNLLTELTEVIKEDRADLHSYAGDAWGPRDLRDIRTIVLDTVGHVGVAGLALAAV